MQPYAGPQAKRGRAGASSGPAGGAATAADHPRAADDDPLTVFTRRVEADAVDVLSLTDRDTGPAKGAGALDALLEADTDIAAIMSRWEEILATPVPAPPPPKSAKKRLRDLDEHLLAHTLALGAQPRKDVTLDSDDFRTRIDFAFKDRDFMEMTRLMHTQIERSVWYSYLHVMLVHVQKTADDRQTDTSGVVLELHSIMREFDD